MKQLLSESGQAVLEYVILLAVVITMVAIAQSGLGGAVKSLQTRMLCEIAAACPKCPPPISGENDKLRNFCK